MSDIPVCKFKKAEFLERLRDIADLTDLEPRASEFDRDAAKIFRAYIAEEAATQPEGPAPDQTAAVEAWISTLRDAVARHPALLQLSACEVSIACGIACEPPKPPANLPLTIRWWQGGQWSDYSVIYPREEWGAGIEGLVADAAGRALAKWERIKIKTGAE